MKDLTHYFNSPTEEKEVCKTKASETSPVETVETKATSKKRKINLSKSKSKKGKNIPTEDKDTSSNNSDKCKVENNHEENTTENLSSKKSKKRKIEDNRDSSIKKIKIAKSLKTRDSKSNANISVESEKTPSVSKVTNNCNVLPNTEKECIVLESSNSCDEPLVKIKKPRILRKNLFLDSDDEFSLNEKESLINPLENSEKSGFSSKNSLFSYFNKVDKETALKQKAEKIKVQAIVHCPPSGEKSERRSFDKILCHSKSKKHKNKTQLDNSDTIEVISSEEIIDENSSIIVNAQSPPKIEQKEESSSNNQNTMNVSKPKQTNLASIFIPKKIDKTNKDNKNISPQMVEEEMVLSGGKENIISEKQSKESKPKEIPSKTSSKLKKSQINKTSTGIKNSVEDSLTDIPLKESKTPSKTSLKRKKGQISKNSPGNKQSVKGDSTDDPIKESKSPKAIKSLSLTNKKPGLVGNKLRTKRISNNLSDFVKTIPDAKASRADKVNSGTTIELEEKNETTLQSPKNVKHIQNHKSCDSQTPEKSNSCNSKSSNNSDKTPKQKALTLNGYFMPKNNTSSLRLHKSEQKCQNTKSPAWVMKVRLSSATKGHNCSEEESEEDSQDSTKEKEALCNTQEKSDDATEKNQPTPPVVVIDGDDNTIEDSKDDSRKRRSLPRNAKKPNQIIVDDEEEEKEVVVNPQPQKPVVKMWPFFQKGGACQPKEAPVVDEAKLKAKMLFLGSGVPEVIKRKVETVQSDAVLGLPASFPTISHVMQAEENAIVISTETAKLILPQTRSISPLPVIPPWDTLVSTKILEEPEIPVFQRLGNVKAYLEKLKEEEPKAEVKVWYKKLKGYKNKAESDIWTEVYKPSNSADMVGNSENIKKLKSWLENLKNCRKREGSVSSGDEFVNEDSDGESNSFNNMAVISGPCGCGKTSAVYAIAKELDINVLEINASCNRSGKRILAEFSESTQSHHVERAQSINGFFNNQSSGKKKKRKKSKISNESKSEKTSLILVEDADLLFTDCDEGFMPALSSLAASSKRPIILVTNQAHTPHLDRFNNSKLLQLTFTRPRPSKLGLWLRLLGLVEGVMLTPEFSLRLVTHSHCDVRRCLLQLQLMVHSNNSEIREKLSAHGLWWRWPAQYKLNYELPTLLEPEEENAEPKSDNKLLLKQLQSISDTTRRLACLDVLSMHSKTECAEDEDPCPVAWQTRCRDSTALTPSNDNPEVPYSGVALWLAQSLAQEDSERMGQTSQETRWLSILRQGENYFMSGISPTVHTSHQSVTCDYLPTLRELGRSEQVRLTNYTRRANRFFNYLQGLGIHASKSYRDFMCNAFS